MQPKIAIYESKKCQANYNNPYFIQFKSNKCNLHIKNKDMHNHVPKSREK